jgi:hypothetical protein
VDFSHEITPSTPESTPILHPNSGMKFKKFSNRVLFLFVILVTSLDMNDFKKLMEYRDDLVRKIEYHQKMDFELRENLSELEHSIETRNFQLAKQKLGI